MFLLAVVVLPACAAVTNEEIMSDSYIRQHGHSEEMVRLIDLQSSQINGIPSKYKSQNPEWYEYLGVHDRDLNEFLPIKFVRKAFMYFDKSLDDGMFMQNDIKYTNRYDDL